MPTNPLVEAANEALELQKPVTVTRDRSKLLWSELTKEERAEEKREFLESYAAECGGKPEDHQMQWETYLNQEGWTGRDERILMRRDREREREEREKKPLNPGEPVLRFPRMYGRDVQEVRVFYAVGPGYWGRGLSPSDAEDNLLNAFSRYPTVEIEYDDETADAVMGPGVDWALIEANAKEATDPEVKKAARQALKKRADAREASEERYPNVKDPKWGKDNAFEFVDSHFEVFKKREKFLAEFRAEGQIVALPRGVTMHGIDNMGSVYWEGSTEQCDRLKWDAEKRKWVLP